MRRLPLLLLVVLLMPAVAEAHRLGAERAAHRARFFLRDLERQSHVFTHSDVPTSSCLRVTDHSRSCIGHLSGTTAESQPVRCTVRVEVRFRSRSSTSTTARLSAYDCHRGS